MIRLDPFSIGIATFLYVIIHFTWYSKWLFGVGLTGSKVTEIKNKILLRTVSNLVQGAIIAYFLSFFEGYLNVTSVFDGMFVAFCIWLGFVVTTEVSSVIWLKKPIRLFFIDTGANLLSYVVMGGIIGA